MPNTTVSAAGGAMPASSRQTARNPRQKRIKLCVTPVPVPASVQVPATVIAPLPRPAAPTLDPSTVLALSLVLGLVTFILGGIA